MRRALFKNANRRIFAICFLVLLLALLLSLNACTAIFEPLLTERQVLNKMSEIYGEEFSILSVESIEGGWKGKRFLVAPVDDPEVIITVEDKIVGDPLLPVLHHTFSEDYAKLLLNRYLVSFAESHDLSYQGKILHEIDLPVETAEETIHTLASFINGLNSEYPFQRENVFLSFYELNLSCEKGDIRAEIHTEITKYDGKQNLFMDADQVYQDLMKQFQRCDAIYQFSKDFSVFLEASTIDYHFDLPDPLEPYPSSTFTILLNKEEIDETVTEIETFINAEKSKEIFMLPGVCLVGNAVTIRFECAKDNSLLANYRPFGKGFSTSDQPPFPELDTEALIAEITSQMQEHPIAPSNAVNPNTKYYYGDEIDLNDLDGLKNEDIDMDKYIHEEATIGSEIVEGIYASLGEMVRVAAPASVMQIQEAERLLLMPFPQELESLLQYSNGIEELMLVGDEKIAIDWILYPLDEIVNTTQFYQEKYDKKGIFFAGDGAGDPFYITDNGEVSYFHPIVDEDETVAASLTEFYQNSFPK